MGLKTRIRSERLAQKLKQIRENMDLSQNEILKRIEFEDTFDRSTISYYENGKREPPLPVLLAYAKLANVYVDVLIDDEIDLPKSLPSRKKFSGVIKLKE